MMNIGNIEKLKSIVRKNDFNLPYINLDSNGNYAGWVTNFHIYDKKTRLPVKLDLTLDNDLFILFALASCWSRTGQWENSACFAVYLKMAQKDSAQFWNDYDTVSKEKCCRVNSVKHVLQQYDMSESGSKIAFRSDFYDSMKVLSESWDGIKQSLQQSELNNDYQIFISYISSISGLGARNNKMKIKIPLLLRELRIQNIYKNIPGKWCCVPDQRVQNAAMNDKLSIYLPTNVTMQSVLKSSEIIYNLFGDLYDIPLFAYEDLKDFL